MRDTAAWQQERLKNNNGNENEGKKQKLDSHYNSVDCYASANVWQEASYRRERV